MEHDLEKIDLQISQLKQSRLASIHSEPEDGTTPEEESTIIASAPPAEPPLHSNFRDDNLMQSRIRRGVRGRLNTVLFVEDVSGDPDSQGALWWYAKGFLQTYDFTSQSTWTIQPNCS